MLLRLSLFLEGEVYPSYAVSLFLRVEMHLSRRTDDFGALSGKKQLWQRVVGPLRRHSTILPALREFGVPRGGIRPRPNGALPPPDLEQTHQCRIPQIFMDAVAAADGSFYDDLDVAVVLGYGAGLRIRRALLTVRGRVEKLPFGGSRPGRRPNRDRNFDLGAQSIMRDYFGVGGEPPVYSERDV